MRKADKKKSLHVHSYATNIFHRDKITLEWLKKIESLCSIHVIFVSTCKQVKCLHYIQSISAIFFSGNFTCNDSISYSDLRAVSESCSQVSSLGHICHQNTLKLSENFHQKKTKNVPLTWLDFWKGWTTEVCVLTLLLTFSKAWCYFTTNSYWSGFLQIPEYCLKKDY